MLKKFLFLALTSFVLAPSAQAQCGACKYKVGNMVLNGSFELGNTSFSSDYLYSPNLYPEANYFVGADASNYHGSFVGSDHTSGFGNFMVVNGAPTPGTKVWCQTVVVVPNTDYNFSTWVTSVHASNPALLQFSINGVQIGDIFSAPNSTNVWEEFFVNWSSGSALTATICIENMSTIASGNDFGIDDISFAPCLDFDIVNRPELGFLDTIICSGQEIDLILPPLPGFTVNWAPDSLFGDPGAFTQNLTFENLSDLPITYTITIESDSAGLGCIYSEDIVIQVNPLPQLSLGMDTAICGGPLTLSPDFLPGSIFNWSNGSTQETIDISASGSYSLDVDLFGCSISDEIEVIIDTLPSFNLGPDLAFCEGDTLQISAPIAGLWNDGNANPNKSISQSDTLIYTSVNGTCSFSDTLVAEQKPMPLLNLGEDIDTCQGPASLKPNFSPGSILSWNNGATSDSLVTSTSGLYILEATLLGCTTIDSVQVHIDTLPSFSLGPDLAFCEGDTLQISAPIAGLWNDGNANPNKSISQSDTLIYTSVNGTCSYSDTLIAEEKAYPVVDLGKDTSLCNQAQYELRQNIGGLWNGVDPSPSIIVSTDTIITLEAQNGPCAASDQIQILFHSILAPSLPDDSTICASSAIEVDIQLLPGEACIWNDGVREPYRSIGLPGSYWVEKYTPSCNSRDSMQIDTVADIIQQLPASLVACEDNPSEYSYPLAPEETILWDNGSSNPNITLSENRNYTAIISNGYCQIIDSIRYVLDSLPLANLAPIQSICENESLELLVQPVLPYVYQWENGNQGPSLNVNEAGTYAVNISNGACTKNLLSTVSIAANPSPNLPDTLISCFGDPIEIYSELPGLWNDGSFGNTLSTTDSGWHFIQVDNGACSKLDSTYVYIKNLPQPEFFPLPICTDDVRSVPFTEDYTAYHFFWEDNGSDNMQREFADSSAKYYYQYSEGLCIIQGFINVSRSEKPNLLLPDSLRICEDASITLSAQIPSGYSFEWGDGNRSDEEISISDPGEYRIRAWNNTCNATDTCVLFVDSLPKLKIHPVDSICEGSTKTYSLPSYTNFTLSWMDGSTADTSMQTSGILEYQMQGAVCSANNQFNIVGIAKPTVSVLDSISFCEGDSLVIAPIINSPLDYQSTWNGIAANNYTAKFEEDILLVVSHAFCAVEKSLKVKVDSLAALNIVDSLSFCEGEKGSVSFVPEPGVSYSWSDGNSNSSRDFSSSGNYLLSISKASCSADYPVHVQEITYPSIELDSSYQFCEGSNITLRPQVNNFTNWYWASTLDQQELFYEEQNLVLLAFNESCETQKISQIKVDERPAAYPPKDTIICQGDTLKLILQLPFPYSWDNGDSVLMTSTANTYTYTQHNATCSVSSTFTLRTQTKPIFNFPDSLICSTDSVFTNFGTAGFEFKINNSYSSGEFLKDAGVYHLEASNGVCTLNTKFKLLHEDFEALDLGNNKRFCEGTSLNLTPDFPSNYNFSWDDGYTSSTREFTNEGWYAATIQGQRCLSRDTVGIIEIASPKFNMESSATVCEGDSLMIMPTNVQEVETWQWNDLPQSPEATRYFSTAGNYSLNAFNNGCHSKKDISITYQENPLFDVENELFACEKAAIIYRLNPDPNFYYLFNGSIYTLDSLFITEAGDYPILVNVNGCSFVDTLKAHFIAYPNPQLEDSISICSGDSTLVGPVKEDGVTYEWLNENQNTNRWISRPGKYTLVSAREMCKRYDYLQVFVDSLAPYSGPKTFEFCENLIGQESFNISHPKFVKWLDFEGDTISPKQAGFFPFILENGTCSSLDSIQVIEQRKPDLEPLSLESCDGGENVFSSPLSEEFTLSWGGYSTDYHFTTNINLETFLHYSNGICSDSISLSSIIHPNPSFKNIEVKTICEGDEIYLSYPLEGNEELWWYDSERSYYGSILQTTAPVDSNKITYRLSLENSSTHCSSDSLIIVPIDQHPKYEIEENYIGCNTPVLVDVNAIADSLIWSHGDRGSVIAVDSTNWYYFTAYNGVCQSSDSVNVYVIAQPPIELGPDTFICRGESLTLNAPIQVLWSTGVRSKEITISEEGMYGMMISAMGCSQEDSIYVEKFDLPELSIRDTTVCVGKVYKLPSELEAYQITWTSVGPNAENTIKRAGNYEFLAEGACGDSTYNFQVTYTNCNISLFIPSAFTPNTDGTNELFKAVHDGFHKVRLQIVDRWGELIFDRMGEDPGWDGFYRGNPAKLGVYNVVFVGFYLDENGLEQSHQEFATVTLVH